MIVACEAVMVRRKTFTVLCRTIMAACTAVIVWVMANDCGVRSSDGKAKNLHGSRPDSHGSLHCSDCVEQSHYGESAKKSHTVMVMSLPVTVFGQTIIVA